MCLPGSLGHEEADALGDLVKHGRVLNKSEFLFRQDDRFGSIYSVRSGVLKSVSLSSGGDEKIIGIHLPGELIGLSAMDVERYPVSVQALETAHVCELPFGPLEELLKRSPQLRRHLFRLMSREIRSTQQMTWLLTKKTAEARVVILLINLSARFRALGYAANQLQLNVSRNDIGNFLGMSSETVSRVLTRLRQNGLIRIDGKQVRILKPIQLIELAEGSLA